MALVAAVPDELKVGLITGVAVRVASSMELAMAVVVYVWFLDPSNCGHAAMKVDGGLPVGEVYLSRWPDNTPGQLKATIQALAYGAEAISRSYANDVKAEGGRSPHSVRLTSVDESAIKKAIDENAKKRYYQFLIDNCAVQVSECLDAGVGGSSIMRGLDRRPASRLAKAQAAALERRGPRSARNRQCGPPRRTCMHSNTGVVWRRRDWMALAGAGVFGIRLYGADTDFWNRKNPAEWTDEEIQRLLTKSPWAKPASTIAEPGARGSSSGVGPGTGPEVGGVGSGKGGRQQRESGNTAPSTTQGLVVWESAQVILDARKKSLPKEFKDHYTLSVSGVPLRQIGDGQLFDQLRQFTSLQPNDQPPVQPGTVQRVVGNASAVLVGFSKDVLELSAGDKSIHFATEMGHIVLKTKFDTKEMRYQGHLAL
jgi:hypothetical protein